MGLKTQRREEGPFFLEVAYSPEMCVSLADIFLSRAVFVLCAALESREYSSRRMQLIQRTH